MYAGIIEVGGVVGATLTSCTVPQKLYIAMLFQNLRFINIEHISWVFKRLIKHACV